MKALTCVLVCIASESLVGADGHVNATCDTRRVGSGRCDDTAMQLALPATSAVGVGSGDVIDAIDSDVRTHGRTARPTPGYLA